MVTCAVNRVLIPVFGCIFTYSSGLMDDGNIRYTTLLRFIMCLSAARKCNAIKPAKILEL